MEGVFTIIVFDNEPEGAITVYVGGTLADFMGLLPETGFGVARDLPLDGLGDVDEFHLWGALAAADGKTMRHDH